MISLPRRGFKGANFGSPTPAVLDVSLKVFALKVSSSSSSVADEKA